MLSVMEAQPLAMILAYVSQLASGNSANAPLNWQELTLLQLGFLWWAIALALLEQRQRLRSARTRSLLRLCSLLAGSLVLLVPLLWSGWSDRDYVLVPGICLFVFWLWQRNLERARLGFAYEDLSTSFKVCLGVLLALILLALGMSEGSSFLSQLEGSLTLFFLSGLIALSLTRLGVLRQIHAANGKQADPTRFWLISLTLFCGLLILLVLLLEGVFSLASLLWLIALLQPVWNALGTIIGWILYALAFLIVQPLFLIFSWLIQRLGGQNSGLPHIQAPSSPLAGKTGPVSAQLPPEMLTLGRWIVLIAVATVLVLLVIRSLRRWYLPYETEQFEEVREALDRRELRQKRRKQKQVRTSPEPILGEGARAYYRLLLRETAALPKLAHQPDETPLEYEQRLRLHLEESQQTQDQSQPASTQVLHELTEHYMDERYGQRPLDAAHGSYLRRWLPRLVALFHAR